MAIGWLMLLQNVPWADVIKNAPKLADGAKKLWNTIGSKVPPDEVDIPTTQLALSPEAEAIARLQKQLVAAEAATADLHNQMLASSELIKALAEHNTLLIGRIELNRRRMLWLTGALVIIGSIAVASLMLALASTYAL